MLETGCDIMLFFGKDCLNSQTTCLIPRHISTDSEVKEIQTIRLAYCGIHKVYISESKNRCK